MCDIQKQFYIRRLTGDLKLELTFVCPEYGVLRGGGGGGDKYSMKSQTYNLDGIVSHVTSVCIRVCPGYQGSRPKDKVGRLRSRSCHEVIKLCSRGNGMINVK